MITSINLGIIGPRLRPLFAYYRNVSMVLSINYVSECINYILIMSTINYVTQEQTTTTKTKQKSWWGAAISDFSFLLPPSPKVDRGYVLTPACLSACLSVCLSGCGQEISKGYGQIRTKLDGHVEHLTWTINGLNFGEDLDPDLDMRILKWFFTIQR